jgi:hypothetical protein
MDRRPAEKFQDLIVWQKAHDLVLSIYKMTSSYPRHELFGLRDLGYTEKLSESAAAEDVARLLAGYSRTLLTPVSLL